MKQSSIITIILGMVLLFSLPIQVQGQQDPTEDAIQALQKGDARGLSACFGSNVDLVMPGQEGIRSRTQAEMILRNFFQSNPPGTLSIKHRGSSRDGASFVISHYKSGNKEYRVYFLVRDGNDGLRVRQLKIDLQ